MKDIYDLLHDHPGFPSEWAKKDLRNLLKEAYELISRPAGRVELDRVQPLINVATNELAGRTANLHLIASIAVSSVALFISIWMGYKSDKQSKQWEQSELRILDEMRAIMH
ncbi:MAG: hypothetical protein Greene041619_625 [Candidatus Peregrinibacteria bacterium Greene0416_19]|nr:MAG: hypothetical protein Greene041619_625 [Candidatus Peregrinibacteria bacterium Greene0416_19]